ncbi:leptin-like [Empidonax traillii]|uniref:leptin-like n=1 Tax=Empidonax traillii TaxID=164674 RepID=UPI000FFCF4B3|nr:leptin-like [Empidonax traillii]
MESQTLEPTTEPQPRPATSPGHGSETPKSGHCHPAEATKAESVISHVPVPGSPYPKKHLRGVEPAGTPRDHSPRPNPPCPPHFVSPQLFPLTLRVTGLEGVPEGGVPAGLGVAAQRLQLFQRLLGAVAGGDLRLAQVANDLENLRSLLGVLGALLGCPPPRDPPPAPPAPLAEAPHTVAGVALAQLQGCLEGIATHLEEVPAC